MTLCSTSERPLIIGHRGACGSAPENTLPSFQLAIDSGASLVELDYHHSQDGVPVVIHDDTLDRTTGGRRLWGRGQTKVCERTAAQIQGYDAGGWFSPAFGDARVPLLSEALRFIRSRGGVPVVERKSGDPETCVRVFREEHCVENAILISFDWQFLRAVHELEPRLTLGALGPPKRLADGSTPRRSGKSLSRAWLERTPPECRLIVWNSKVTPEAIALAARRNLPVWVYTINSITLARRLARLGVQGIITNHPEKMRAL